MLVLRLARGPRPTRSRLNCRQAAGDASAVAQGLQQGLERARVDGDEAVQTPTLPLQNLAQQGRGGFQVPLTPCHLHGMGEHLAL